MTVFPKIGPLLKLDHEHSVEPLLPIAFHLGALEVLNHSRMWLPAGKPDDVFHASNFVRTLPRNAKALTATLHDLTAWTMPEKHTRENIAADEAFAERIVCKADRLIAVSESTRRDAIEILRRRLNREKTWMSC